MLEKKIIIFSLQYDIALLFKIYKSDTNKIKWQVIIKSPQDIHFKLKKKMKMKTDAVWWQTLLLGRRKKG